MLERIEALEHRNRELEAVHSENEKLRGSYERLNASMQRSHRLAKLLFWECDGDSLLWRASREVTGEFLGVDPDKTPKYDSELLALIHEDDRERAAAYYDCGDENLESFELDYRVELPDGSIRHIHEIGVPFESEFIDLPCHSGTLQDVTDQKVAEQERDKLIGELEARNREMERFTYTVSHDLKAPLITIRGFIGLLKQDLEAADTARVQEDIEKIAAASAGMREVLDDLLRLSRIGRFVSPSIETPLHDLVNEPASAIAPVLNGVELRIGQDLPAVYGDRTRLVELLQNLMENAAKFMGAQSNPVVEIGAVAKEGEIECYVLDNGVGIEERYHERIFGLFETLGSKESGTGVGLALAKRIVEYHGGRIWVESQGSGRGARVLFTLPQKGA